MTAIINTLTKMHDFLVTKEQGIEQRLVELELELENTQVSFSSMPVARR